MKTHISGVDKLYIGHLRPLMHTIVSNQVLTPKIQKNIDWRCYMSRSGCLETVKKYMWHETKMNLWTWLEFQMVVHSSIFFVKFVWVNDSRLWCLQQQLIGQPCYQSCMLLEAFCVTILSDGDVSICGVFFLKYLGCAIWIE